MLRVTRDQYTYRFAADTAPVGRVLPGERIVFETYDASTGRINAPEDLPTYLKVRDLRAVNPAAGPVFIEGAEPGDELVVTLESIRLAPRGYVRAMPDNLVIQGIAAPHLVMVEVEAGDMLLLPGGIRLPARPMVGVIGTAPTSGEVSTANPSAIGSNLDCNIIHPGARIHLPVHVPGALLALGDVHARMGDAEVSGTGVEINAEVTVAVEVIEGGAHARPWVEADGLLAATGTAPDLTDALSIAVDGLVVLLMERLAVSRADAFALISAAGDVRIGQACARGVLDASVYATFPIDAVRCEPRA